MQRKHGRGMVTVTVWATSRQWEAVRQLAEEGTAWSEPEMGRKAGFTKGQWRDFYGRLKAAGLLLPKGNGPRAGYEPSEALMESLTQRSWARPA